MKNWYFIAIFTVFLGIGGMGVANAKTQRCDKCSYADLREGVEYLGDGQHTVYNVTTGQARTFNVSGWRGRPIELDAPGIVVREVTADSDIIAAASFLRSFEQMTAGTFKTAVEVRADSLGVSGLENATAYTVLTDMNLRARLGDRLVLPLPGIPQLDRLAERAVQAGLSKIGLSDQVLIEITVRMSDGSTVVYFEKLSLSTAQFQPDRSRTANGQAIPLANTVDNQGTWTGGTPPKADNLNDMGNYMLRIGIPVDICGSPIRQLRCSWEVGGAMGASTLRCESTCR